MHFDDYRQARHSGYLRGFADGKAAALRIIDEWIAEWRGDPKLLGEVEIGAVEEVRQRVAERA